MEWAWCQIEDIDQYYFLQNNVDLASLLTIGIQFLLFTYFIIIIVIVYRRILFLLFECIDIVIIAFNFNIL